MFTSLSFSRYFLISLLVATLLLLAIAESAKAYSEPYCREYTRNINVGGRVQEGYGTACMQPDGSWQITSEQGEQLARPQPLYDDGILLKRRVIETPYGYSPYGYQRPVHVDFHFSSVRGRDYHRHRWYNERNRRHHHRYGR